MGQSITELTAAGLLTLGGPMVGAPGDDLDLLCLLSLSLGCAGMLGWACETRERFANQGRKTGIPKREAFAETRRSESSLAPLASASGSGGRRWFG